MTKNNVIEIRKNNPAPMIRTGFIYRTKSHCYVSIYKFDGTHYYGHIFRDYGWINMSCDKFTPFGKSLTNPSVDSVDFEFQAREFPYEWDT